MNDRRNSADVTVVSATVVPGYQVASGGSKVDRFPGGTLLMQTPFFARLGLDLTRFHRGTLNVSVAPMRYKVGRPKTTFEHVKWHPIEPAETFSFFDVRLRTETGEVVDGLVYYPHPETKPEHFQKPDVLELLLPFLPGLSTGSVVSLTIPRDQLSFAAA